MIQYNRNHNSKKEPSRIAYLYKKHCITIFGLLNERSKIWAYEDRAYEQEMIKWKAQMKEQNTEEVEHNASFIDTLIQCEIGNVTQRCFVTDMDLAVKKLIEDLPEIFLNGIRYIFKGKLSNLQDWNYLNAFGELGVLKTLHDQGFTLEQIEVNFPNKRRKDFLFRDTNDKPIMVEVLNIHAHKVKQTAKNIKQYTISKIEAKIAEETKGIIKHQLEMQLMFVPVIWLFGTQHQMDLYPFFKKFDRKYKKKFSYPVIGLCSYINHTDGANVHIHKFGTIESLLRKPYENQGFWTKLKISLKFFINIRFRK